VCSSRRNAGSAMFTIVLSRPTMNRLMQQMARTSPRRGWWEPGTIGVQVGERAVRRCRGYRPGRRGAPATRV
jgi:hypothetical protein